MQNYTKSLNYLKQKLSPGKSFVLKKYSRLLIEENHPSYMDAKIDFNQSKFKFPYLPLYLGQYQLEEKFNKVNVLRLPIRINDENAPIHIPKELLFLTDFILMCTNYHNQHYAINKNAFIYITVRVCDYNNLYYENSKTWHIDGFQGSKINRHIIEQNFIWSNKCPTQFLVQPFFCDGLNPSRHNINDFFEKNANEHFCFDTLENGLYVMNPYNIHRVSPQKFSGDRIFVRLNFSPVEISDPTNTKNPMLKQETPFISDVRNYLGDYEIDETKTNGFRN